MTLPDFRTDEERYLFGLIRGGSPDEFHQLLTDQIDVNATNSEGMTMLHLAAAYGGRPYVLSLLKTGRCNLSIRDQTGRYAYQLAIESARDYAMARLLMWQQVKQADAQHSGADNVIRKLLLQDKRVFKADQILKDRPVSIRRISRLRQLKIALAARIEKEKEKEKDSKKD